jgi:hypothetical protein
MAIRLYCYVDETGQDTEGRLFIVGVVVADKDQEEYQLACETIEQKSGKGNIKWRRTARQRKIDYIGLILKEPLFKGKLCFAVYHHTRACQEATVKAIGLAANSVTPGSDVTVIIDALPKSLEIPIGVQLRRAGVRAKVRGARKDENYALIRLADALCGFVRAATEGQTDMQELLDWGLRASTLRDLSE